MVFSSAIFLFLFLPLVLACGLLAPARARNALLLAFSLLFYAWGEPGFVFLLLGSVLLNFELGRWVERQPDGRGRRWILGAAIALNLAPLAFFKYANFACDNLNQLLGYAGAAPLHWQRVRLPIGISFFTFHALSYVMDIYRRKARAAARPWDTALYIFFFPQLIAGPILRWHAIAPQLAHRKVSLERFSQGVRRFVEGLAKKLLIANTLALPADQIFGLPANQLSPSLAWLGAVCYTLQIYFDFSGYSDMAVGLGRMFGFEFMENFHFPYIAQSIRDFWRRWHISLSSWFRDYLYIPLGGNRCGYWRTQANLVIVFFLCGLWHGASWTFALWGLYHGAFLVAERTRLGSFLQRWPRGLRHVYALAIVVGGWVLFRADSFEQALNFFAHMSGLHTGGGDCQPLARYLTRPVQWALGLGALFSTPVWPWLCSQGAKRLPPANSRELRQRQGVGAAAEVAWCTALFIISAAWLAGDTYNPFIYFRF